MEYPSLRGKVAIITGGANGIGAATARFLAKSGVKLSLIDIAADRLEIVAQECLKISEKFNNPKPFTFAGDLTNDAIRQTFINDTLKTFGRLDILINNAGIGIESSMFDSTMESADKLFSILFRAPYDMSRLATKHLIETKGSIVNIASVCGHSIIILNPAYNSAKAAVLHLTKTVADELAPYGVRVNSISPGAIRTGLSKKCKTLEEDIKIQDEIGRKVSVMKRAGDPEEIARVAAFLVSSESSYMTGSDVVVDGGLLIKHVTDLP